MRSYHDDSRLRGNAIEAARALAQEIPAAWGLNGRAISYLRGYLGDIAEFLDDLEERLPADDGESE